MRRERLSWNTALWVALAFLSSGFFAGAAIFDFDLLRAGLLGLGVLNAGLGLAALGEELLGIKRTEVEA